MVPRYSSGYRSMKDVVPGVDIGGTKIAAGLVDGRQCSRRSSYKYSARHEEELLTVLARIRRGLKSWRWLAPALTVRGL